MTVLTGSPPAYTPTIHASATASTPTFKRLTQLTTTARTSAMTESAARFMSRGGDYSLGSRVGLWRLVGGGGGRGAIYTEARSYGEPFRKSCSSCLRVDPPRSPPPPLRSPAPELWRPLLQKRRDSFMEVGALIACRYEVVIVTGCEAAPYSEPANRFLGHPDRPRGVGGNRLRQLADGIVNRWKLDEASDQTERGGFGGVEQPAGVEQVLGAARTDEIDE